MAATGAFVSSLPIPPSSVAVAGIDGDVPEFRRVLLRPEQLPAELERVKQGILRQLPIAEFDDLAVRAAATDAALRDPPRLVETRYRATLVGEALTGSADWKIQHRRATPGLLTLEPFNLALRKSIWDDGAAAVMGDLRQANHLELFVNRPGDQTLKSEWSARGVPEPNGLRFDLRLPACAIAVLDLDLPASREPVVAHDNGLLSLPLAASATDRRVWRLAFAGGTQIDLVVRPAAGDAPPPLLLAKLRTRQDISPGETACEYSFDLEAPHGGVRDLVVQCDPILRPAEVIVRDLEHWEVQTESDEDEPTRVFIHLREPLQSGNLTLRGTAPAMPDRPWSSPAAAVIGAVPQGEMLTLRVHPDLRLTDWKSRPFRLIDSVTTPERWQMITLQDGLIRTGVARPGGWLRPAGADYQVREKLWWAVDADRMSLTAQLEFDVAHGPLFAIPLRAPQGWEVEHIQADPPELLTTTPLPVVGQDLRIELQKALTPGMAGRLIVQMVRRSPPAEAMPFPDLRAIGARRRDGTFAIRIGAGLQSSVTDATLLDPKLAADRGSAPWGDGAADYVCPLRTASSEGTLHIRPRAARFRVRAATNATVTEKTMAVACRLRLEPESGSVENVAVWIPGAVGPWDWQVVEGINRVRSAQRLEVPPSAFLAGLAARSPWDAIVAAALPSADVGNWWRVSFTRPVSEPIELEALSTVAVPARGCVVPLIRVTSAKNQEYQVTLDTRSMRGWRVQVAGLVEVPADGASFQRRTFRYGDGPAALTLVPDDGRTPAILDCAQLVTNTADPARCIHCLSFRVWDWSAPTVPLDLPADAIVWQIRVNGHVTQPRSATPRGDDFHIEIPAPDADRHISIEVAYTTLGQEVGLVAQWKVANPRLPAGNGALRHIWCLSPNVAPLNPQQWRRLPGNADSAATRPVRIVTPSIPASSRWGDAIARWVNESGTSETVVLDLWALDAAGINPNTATSGNGRLFWEAAGLTALSNGGTVLLTDSGHARGLPADWTTAIGEAARVGFDSSGRFRRALDWVQDSGGTVGIGFLPSDLANGVYWESVNDSFGDAIQVVRPRVLDLIGFGLAVAGLSLAWVGRSWTGRRQWAGLLIWFGLFAAIAIWLPGPISAAARWPLLAAVVVVAWKSLPTRMPAEAPTVAVPRPSAVARAATAGMLFGIWLGGDGQAAAPAPAIVYLVPGPPESPDPRTILAPTDLLDRFDAQIRRGPAGLDGAAWLDARYDGRVVGGRARFTAVLRLHSFASDPSPIVLPLTGVQIGSATLDGAPAYLRTAAERYLVPIHGRGPHTLELSFSVPCPSAGDDRELRFGVPETPISHLTLTASATAKNLFVFSAHGEQRIEIDEGRPQLTADLGRVNSVNVRWRNEGPTPQSAPTSVQETYLWDLTESAARLHGAILFNIGPGSVQSLTIGLPKDLEVAAVAARPIRLATPAKPGEADTSIGWLRAWRVISPSKAGARRMLALDFAAPIGGAWQINLELVPREPYAQSFALSFPSPSGTRSAPPVFAWRGQGVELTDVPPDGVSALTPEMFLREHWIPTKIEADPRPPTRAYQRSAPGMIPPLRLRAETAPRERATADIFWRIGQRRASVEAAVHVMAPGGTVSLIEILVPTGVTIADVRGRDVNYWSRTGQRLQVWLDRPSAEATVRVTGSVARPNGTERFDIPTIQPVSASAGGTLRVSVRDGWTLKPLQISNLSESASAIMGEVCYTIGGAHSSRASVLVRASAEAADKRPEFDDKRAMSKPATPPAASPSPTRAEFTTVETARTDCGQWVYRATIWLTQPGPAERRVVWPDAVHLVAIELDGHLLAAPSDPVDSIAVPLATGLQRLELTWLCASAEAAPSALVAPTLQNHGDQLPVGPVLWTLLAPPGVNAASDDRSLPPSVVALYRAAAQLKLADVARTFGPAGADQAKIARSRAASELRRADAPLNGDSNLPLGPGGITIADWRKQLGESLRASTPANVAVGFEDLPFDGVFARGVPASWYIPAGDEGPHLSWTARTPSWPTQLLQTAAIIALAGIGVWWGGRLGADAWPEHLILLGIGAWAAMGGMIWLLPAVIGFGARVTIAATRLFQRYSSSAPKASSSISGE